MINANIGRARALAVGCSIAALAVAAPLTAVAAQNTEPFPGLDNYVTKAMQTWKIPGLAVAIVGDGPARAAVERELRGMHVTWLGRLGGAELGTAYAALDVFVHTGSEETFGQTVQEAHASGLPVVAPRAGGPVDLVEHGVDGLLYPPADDRALRAAVAMLAQDAPLRMRMGEAGRRAVLGRGWDAICGELIGHYERVVLDASLHVQAAGRQRAYS